MKKKIIITALILAAVAAIAFLPALLKEKFAYSGVCEAVEVNISPRLSDVLTKINIEEGSGVKQGDLLALLECKETALALDIASKEYTRAQQLLKGSSGSKENYDLKKNAYERAKIRRGWCDIYSPINGRVLYKYVEEGEFAPVGKKLFTLADLSEIDVWFYVEHNLVPSLSVNCKVDGYLPETKQHFEGYIADISGEAEFTPKNVQTRKERTNLVYGVKVKFQNDAKLTLKPGMTLETVFNCGG